MPWQADMGFNFIYSLYIYIFFYQIIYIFYKQHQEQQNLTKNIQNKNTSTEPHMLLKEAIRLLKIKEVIKEYIMINEKKCYYVLSVSNIHGVSS